MSKFKLGDRVRRTYSRNAEMSAGDTGTVVEVDGYGNWPRVKADKGGYTGVHNPAYLELVTKGGEVKSYQRKTYRLLKGTAELRVGAVVQEKCDDGDQDFIVLDESFVKYPNESGGKRYTLPRQAVESEPKWFVEVFQVEPQFMTREDLDEWKAFQSRKKPGRKASTKRVVKTTEPPFPPKDLVAMQPVKKRGRPFGSKNKPKQTSGIETHGYNVGDRVKVLSSGAFYSSYEGWARRHGLSKWKEGRRIGVNRIYTITAIHPHSEGSGSTLACLEDAKGNQFIFGLYGSLEPVETPRKARTWTPAQRKAQSERMKAIHARKAA